jgi:hypothetical protein
LRSELSVCDVRYRDFDAQLFSSFCIRDFVYF